jgi:hypothetical protein
VASYDSPGHADRGPAGVVVQSTGAGAGSAATPVPLTIGAEEALAPLGVVLGMPNLTALTGGSVAESVPQIMATVHSNDTAVPAQSDLYSGTDGHPLSAVSGDALGYTTGGQANGGPYGGSHVVTPTHWAAAGGSGAGSPS